MDILWAFLAGIVGALFGAFVQSQLPPDLIPPFLGRTPRNNLIRGEWDSWWGNSENIEELVLSEHETIRITKQWGERIWGVATRENEKGKKWDIVGRFDGQHLQMFYYPSKDSLKPTFLDYGSYFLIRQGDGSMMGFSAGIGPEPMTKKVTITAERSYMRQVA